MKEERTEPKQASQETDSLVKRLAGPSTGKAGYYYLNILRMKHLKLQFTSLPDWQKTKLKSTVLSQMHPRGQNSMRWGIP